MIASKVIRRQHQEVSPTRLKPLNSSCSTLQLVPKTSSLPKQFQKGEKFKTVSSKTETLRHSKNNSATHLSTCDNTKIVDSITNAIAYFNNKNDDNPIRNELRQKIQLINELQTKIQDDRNNSQTIIQQLEEDIKTLNITIENICEQLQLKTEQLQNIQVSHNQQILLCKQENSQLLEIIKQGSYTSEKENIHNYKTSKEFKQLQNQLEIQKQTYYKKENELLFQIQELQKKINELQKINSELTTQNYNSYSTNKDLDKNQIKVDKMNCDEKLDNIYRQINNVVEKHSNVIDTQHTKEITRIKQIVSIQKKQIELQQKTILNQHFEIQSLQTILYKNDSNSFQQQQDSQRFDKKESQIITNEFTASPKEEVYHINDSQSEIKPKYFLDNIQNTFQKYQIITEESTFRN